MDEQDGAAQADAPGANEDATLVEVRLAMALAIAGGRLDAEQAAALRRLIAGQVAQARALQRTPLGNADEPEIAFAPYRAPEAGA